VRELTPLQLGSPMRCNDGPAGSLSDLVIEPAERRVTHIVGAPNGAGRMVPAELLVTGQAPAGDVVLSCSVADVLRRGTIRSFSYVGAGAFPQNDDTGTATLPIESVTALETDRLTVSLT
jgi:hypothetical protein